jgi:hypothetical protein
MTTKAPYEPEGSLAFCQPAPRGFKPVFTENVQRHGDADVRPDAEPVQRASSAAAAGHTAQRIEVVAASQERTMDSAFAFVTGLEAADPGLTPVVGATETNNNLLYFHKAAINQDYVASNLGR